MATWSVFAPKAFELNAPFSQNFDVVGGCRPSGVVPQSLNYSGCEFYQKVMIQIRENSIFRFRRVKSRVKSKAENKIVFDVVGETFLIPEVY
jgi:hypothetical protein